MSVWFAEQLSHKDNKKEVFTMQCFIVYTTEAGGKNKAKMQLRDGVTYLDLLRQTSWTNILLGGLSI